MSRTTLLCARSPRLWLWASLVSVGVASAGAPPATRGHIPFRNQPAATTRQTGRELADVLHACTAAGQRHVVVQLDQPLTDALRAQLHAGGVIPLTWLSDRACFAALDPDRASVITLGRIRALRCILPIAPAWKLHPLLGPDHLVPDARVTLVAVFFPDVPLDDAARVLSSRYDAGIHQSLPLVHALLVELPAQQVTALAQLDTLQWLEPPLPALGENNDDVRARTGAEIVYATPYGLTGAGVTVLVYDSGTVAAIHPDFGTRVNVRDSGAVRTHATHVAGTIAGTGSASGGTYRGLAPAATIESYTFQTVGPPAPGFLYTDPGDLAADYAAAVQTYGVVLANNSIGSNIELNLFDCAWQGDYGVTSQLIDTIVRGSLGAPLPVVWSAGNERAGDRCDIEGFGDYYSLAPPACAKNPIVVGALHSDDDSVTTTSSWGPTDDGRVKPDLTAPGCQAAADAGVTSCDKSGGYTSLCSSSMATATVTGLCALLVEDYRQHYPAQGDPSCATLKALLIHTAADEVAGDDQPGPDYRYGYGSVRIQPAVDLLRAGAFVEQALAQDELYTTAVLVTGSDQRLTVTLVWDDAPGPPNVSPVLVNDLDLRVIDPADQVHYPWTLDPENPGAPATRTQPDHLNNVEQVVIDAPTPGVYRIEIVGATILVGPQSFTLCATPAPAGCTSAGTLSFHQAAHPCVGTLGLWLSDCDLNTDPETPDSVSVPATSDSEPAGELVTLTETSADSGVFGGTLPLDPNDAPGVLCVTHGDTIIVTYLDADDGAGGYDRLVEAYTIVDCIPPIISNVTVTDIRPRRATITCTTDEPTTLRVDCGLTCDDLTLSATSASPQTVHAVTVTGLTPLTSYVFTVIAADAAGNVTSDDAAGACYEFTTAEIPPFFVEQFTDDLDLAGYSVLLVPDSSTDGYTLCADLIAALPTDPADGLVLDLPEDGYVEVVLDDAGVQLYGQTYDTFFVGSNGYITFTAGDTSWQETLAQHFALPRVAPLFRDLSPQTGTITWKQLDDRAVVTWWQIPEYGTSHTNTFQVEMYFDGRIQLAWTQLQSDTGLVGLSSGTGLFDDFTERDLTAATPCGPRRPIALALSLVAPDDQPLTIALQATDDGDPDPPGTLSFVIDTLPEFELLDAGNDHVITAGDLPYTLVDDGHEVVFRRFSPYAESDTFTYRADDGGTAPTGGASDPATVTITIGVKSLIYSFSLDSDPLWTCEGLWAFGPPQGAGSYAGDPTSGFTGEFVYGYNLGGDYTNNLTAQYLTAGPLDLTAVWRTELRFQRWLGIESAAFDHATLAVSNNNQTWLTLWSHTGGPIHEHTWSAQVANLGTTADHQSTVYLRWGMGPTDASGTAPGWNLDDLEIWALEAPNPFGDLNCDGQVDFADVNPFVLVLVSVDNYYTVFPDCNHWYADANRDGEVSIADINAFVLAIVGGYGGG